MPLNALKRLIRSHLTHHGRFMSLIWTLFALSQSPAQSGDCQGQILDPSGKPVFAANVFLQQHPQTGTVTDPSGLFTLAIDDLTETDSLVVKYAGYDLLVLSVEGCLQKCQTIQLREREMTLDEVRIRARSPVAEQFSVRRLEQMDIYTDPFAAADPLRAITSLPASTNADESANPVLRGSAADLSQVIVNGVPIYQPVRNSQLNGIGNFSLFNTEILERQDLYASNPPLTYGNAAAGLVDIQTNRSRPSNSWRAAISMANLGIFRNQQLPGEGFAQIYGNWQFSNLFTGIHPRSLDNLQSFGALDLGAHLYLPIGKSWTLQTLSYGIRESYEVNTRLSGQEELVSGARDRTFHVVSLRRKGKKDVLSVNVGQDLSQSDTNLGALDADRLRHQSYYAVEYKRYATRNLSWQMGANVDHWQETRQDVMPRYFFAFEKGAPTIQVDTSLHRTLIEGHGYVKWDPVSQIHLSAGIRAGMAPGLADYPYLGMQASGRWDVFKDHSVLLSAGKYHSFLPMGVRFQGFSMIQSRQVALDYQIRHRDAAWDIALFHKAERGPQSNGGLVIDEAIVSGVELAWQQNMGDYLALSLANTWLRQRIRFVADSEAYRGRQDFPFFLKGALSVRHPVLPVVTVTSIVRPGQVITPIVAGNFQPDIGRYAPVFPDEVHGERLPYYHNLSLALSRYIPLHRGSLVLFLNGNNLLNRRNPQERRYAADYSSFTYDMYSLRTLYAGLVWEWQ